MSTVKQLLGEEKQKALEQVPSWTEKSNPDGIFKSFKFHSFVEAFGFMSQIALVAEKVCHPITGLKHGSDLNTSRWITTQNGSTYTTESILHCLLMFALVCLRETLNWQRKLMLLLKAFNKNLFF